MAIRRFKKKEWPNSSISEDLDYLETIPNYPLEENTLRINIEGEHMDSEPEGINQAACIIDPVLIELPCYARDLIEGDLAIILDVHKAERTVYIHSQGTSDSYLCMVSLDKKGSYWIDINSTRERLPVLALLGNAFNEERITYGVKKYG